MIRSRHSGLLAAGLILSLAVKLLVWGVVWYKDSALFTWADTKGYQDSALMLLERGEFTVSSALPDIVQTFRTPGYPVFLAAVYGVIGVSYAPVVLLQIFISLGTIILAYTVASRIWNKKIGLIAAIILCLDTLSFTYSLKVLTETLFALIMMVLILCCVGILQGKSRGWLALAAGVCMGAGTLIRPVGLYMIAPVLLALIAAGIKQKWGWRLVVKTVLALAVPYVICVGGWTYRNYKMTGQAIFTSFDGYYLLFWHGSAIVSARDGISIEEAQIKLGMEGRGEGYKQMHPETKDYNFETMAGIWKQEGLKLIKQNPLIFLRTEVSGMLRVMFRPGIRELLMMVGASDNFREIFNLGENWDTFMLVGWSVLFLIILYMGIIRYFIAVFQNRKLEGLDILFWLLIIYFIVTSGGPAAQSRYRVPVMPLLAFYAAQGWWMMWERWKSGRRPPVDSRR